MFIKEVDVKADFKHYKESMDDTAFIKQQREDAIAGLSPGLVGIFSFDNSNEDNSM